MTPKTKTFYCTCCERELNPAKMVWLEMDNLTGLYHTPGEVPEDRSQGLFDFGSACAKRKLRETKDAYRWKA